jgi:hypothetical protein
VDVLGLAREQLGVRLRGDPAAAGLVEADGVLGGRRRDVEAMRSKLTRDSGGLFEQRGAQAPVPVVAPDVKERKLDEVALRPEEDGVNDSDPDDPIAIEDGDEVRSTVERGLEPRQRILRLARWPTGQIEERRSRHETAVAELEDAVDDLAPIDLEDSTDLLTTEATPGEAAHDVIVGASRY